MVDAVANGFDFSISASDFQDRYLAPFWQRRMAEVSVLCRVVELECPRLSSDCGVDAAYRQLQSAAAQAEKVLRSPEFLLWINVSRHFVLRNMHQSLPVGHVRDHFGELRRFAFAATCANAGAGEGAATVQQDGRVSLPGLGLVLSAGRQHAGRAVGLKTNGRTVAATLGAQEFTVALNDPAPACEPRNDAAGWGATPRLGWGIVLDDSIELSRPHRANNPAWKIRHLDPDDVARWLSIGQEACGLISAVEERLWIPVRDVLASIVPLESPPQVNLSGTCDDVLGCICTSRSANAAILAETLVHEAAHTTLHILTDGTHYWEAGDGGRLYRSPWRKDLRPISGMVHGIFAFLAVCEFWAALLASAQAREFGQLGSHRLRTVARQVERALAELRGSTELTAAGRRMLAAVERKIDTLNELSRRFSPSAMDEQSIDDRLAEHDVALPSSALRAGPSSKSRIDSQWSRKLGVYMPPPSNPPALRLVRRETISDHIHNAASTNDAVVAEWEALLRTTSATEPESALLVQGSISYGRGEFLSAVGFYASYVERRWDDMDAWRLLGAALRRAAKVADALTIAFDIDQLQQAKAVELRQRFGSEWPFHLHRYISGFDLARSNAS
jgi:HEXXH motif-containing protein